MPDPTSAPPPRPWLRATDQAAAALVIGVGLAVIGLDHYWRGGTDGRLIEIERAVPQPAVYWIDINAASVEEWLQLPEIGESLAQRIVADRLENGPFRDHQDLLRVRGIGPRTLERITPYLRPLPRSDATAGR